MPLNLPIRQEKAASYRTLIKGALITSLRSVFTTQYSDPQFQNLRIEPEFSLKRVTWPAIYIVYNEREVRNAGVGHLEYFPDPNGLVRKWMHSMFEGMIEFDIVTESPLDRDVLADALVEVIRFGTLDTLLNNFWQGIYGSVTDPYSNLAVMQQIALNSDTLSSGGDSFGPSPWGAEDLPLYTTSYAIDILGGYYNSITDMSVGLVREVIQFPYIEGDPVPFNDDPNNIWFYPFDYFDEDIVEASASMETHEAAKSDAATVTAQAVISTPVDMVTLVDSDMVTSQASMDSTDVRTMLEATTVSSQAVLSSVNTDQSVDAATEQSVAVASAANAYNTIDTGTVTAQFNGVTTESEDALDLQTVAAVSVMSSIDTAQTIDAGTV